MPVGAAKLSSEILGTKFMVKKALEDAEISATRIHPQS